MLITAAFLAVLIGLSHSVLGERYILIRLFRRGDLPVLFGSDWFTRRTLRFAWHLTTAAWWGMAGLLLAVSDGGPDLRGTVLAAIALIFLVSALLAAGFTRFRHFAWPIFLAISLMAAFSI